MSGSGTPACSETVVISLFCFLCVSEVMGQVHDVSNKPCNRHVPPRDSCHCSKAAEGWLRGQKLEDIKVDNETLSL